MNNFDLSGDVAIVTGGAQGIGLACAERMAQSGAKVVLWDISEEDLEAAKSKIGGEVQTALVDITNI